MADGRLFALTVNEIVAALEAALEKARSCRRGGGGGGGVPTRAGEKTAWKQLAKLRLLFELADCMIIFYKIVHGQTGNEELDRLGRLLQRWRQLKRGCTRPNAFGKSGQEVDAELFLASIIEMRTGMTIESIRDAFVDDQDLDPDFWTVGQASSSHDPARGPGRARSAAFQIAVVAALLLALAVGLPLVRGPTLGGCPEGEARALALEAASAPRPSQVRQSGLGLGHSRALLVEKELCLAQKELCPCLGRDPQARERLSLSGTCDVHEWAARGGHGITGFSTLQRSTH